MSIPFFDITCVTQRGYGYQKRPSTYRLPALKGRPRYRLRDTWASYVFTVEWDFTVEQYEQFQQFWYNEIGAGRDSFEMRLMMDDPEYYGFGGEIYQVHAVEGFQSVYSSFDFWTVRLQVEVAGGFRIGLVSCPTIYGGPIDALAPNDYYGGPIDNLAANIIAPCDGLVGEGADDARN